MSNKSKKTKKTKKPKPKEVAILSASEIKKYIDLKYVADDNGFWDWFFSDCPWGNTGLLSLHEEDYDIIQPKFKTYFNILKDDFLSDADEELCLEIENDL